MQCGTIQYISMHCGTVQYVSVHCDTVQYISPPNIGVDGSNPRALKCDNRKGYIGGWIYAEYFVASMIPVVLPSGDILKSMTTHLRGIAIMT